jgi:hypothetical protein
MQEKIIDASRRPRNRKRPLSFVSLLLFIFGVSGAAVIAYNVLWQKSDDELLIAHEKTPAATQLSPSVPANDLSRQQYHLSSAPENQHSSSAVGQEGLATSAAQSEVVPPQPADQQNETAPAAPAESMPRESHLKEPAAARAAIAAFYSHLDQQEYLRTFHFDAPSEIYFSRLIQKMLDTPPVVSGETNDLYTVLQNTAHFFRIVGRENMLALKAIISNEQKSYEGIMADFYSISRQPDHLRESFSIALNEDALYDYAGFFLTTMGGRLYLFRRDSSLRMIVNYYAILVVDEAVQTRRNRHGIDIRPVIDNLIGEIENSGNQLQLKEQYLDNLYDLKEKYLSY